MQWIAFCFQMSNVLQRDNQIIVMSIFMKMALKNNYIMHRKVIIPGAVGYLILGICARAIFQIEHWAPKVYVKYIENRNNFWYLQSQHAVFISTHLLQFVACQRFPLHYYFFPTMGGEVFKITFMQHWNSIKINTNEMFISMAAGALSGMTHSSSGETLTLS